MSGVPFVRLYLMLVHFVTKPEHLEVFDWTREKIPNLAIGHIYLLLFASTPSYSDSDERKHRARLNSTLNQLCVMKEKAETEGPPMTVDEIFDTVLPPRSGYARGRGPGPKPPSQAQRDAEQ
ncbi:hypothetical protein FNV43_RR02454 [Rhamnella rubrinervis]|uniref:Uncharacterized protein n=1 Tax=Rhamnella rubrinervis TaxID=2594499 RepID=A0A8K0HS88_9ROSA|nr:hypothetical protein FNV43_RR02454 [Rhamnella rubrinervis]